MDSNKIAEIYEALIQMHYRISNLEDGKTTMKVYRQRSHSAIEKVSAPSQESETQSATLTLGEMAEVREGFVAVVEERDMLLASDQVLQEELKRREEEIINLTAERNDLLVFKKAVTETLGISPETHPNHIAQILTSMKEASTSLAKVRAAFK
ncbi:hypothetical protein [Pseudomonas phage vB_PaeP_TUMS_P10]|nr:hypothetical protein [Pseudomonas phage vB_PaeS_TUMS_P6]UNI72012.1 hypothetical protein [Pseudomonas phage vB_PaeP_TUMS_P10]